jgi:cobalamin biosynthesis Mg chelatase CobN
MENKGSKMSSSSSSKKSKGLSKMSKSSKESKSMKSIKSRKSKSSKSKSSSSKSKDSKSMKSSKSKSSKSKSSKTKSSKKSKSHGNTADESIEDEEDLDVNNKVHYDVEGKALPSSVENSKQIEEGDSVATNSKGFMSASRVETWLLVVAILLAMTIMFVPRFFTAARATRPPDYAPIPISSAK